MTPGKCYAGIGSRRTPDDVLLTMVELAERLALMGWTLRSGHAPGADRAFEDGAGRLAEVFLPWPSFENSEPLDADVIVDRPTSAAMNLAPQFHPAWDRLGQGARKLMARNVHQVLGRDCRVEDRSSFVLCWTPQALGRGGTGQAIRMARHYGVPVFDLADERILTRVVRGLSTVE